MNIRLHFLSASGLETAIINTLEHLLPSGDTMPPTPLKPLQWYKQLATKKGRLAAGAFLVEGHRAIAHIRQHHPDAIVEIVTVADPAAAWQPYPVRYVTESQLRAICATQTPQGTLAVVRSPADLYSHALPPRIGRKVVLLEDVQDPGNVGTLIRTAAAFGFAGVLLTEKCADPLAPKCVQSTAGTILNVWIRRTPQYLELVRELQQQGYTCVAADLHGTAAPAVLSASAPLLLVLGNEAAGLSAALLQRADVRLKIPLSPQAESLNVAACGAICMYLSTAHDT
jgi:TrmH family RNA methyltransferase